MSEKITIDNLQKTAITLDYKPYFNGKVRIPGSKSMSNRALLLSALAVGTTNIDNLLDSDDVRHMLNALGSLGGEINLNSDKTQAKVKGLGKGFNLTDGIAIFLGNAGTAMRPLTAAICASDSDKPAKVVLTGEPRMSERPILHLVEALQQLGAEIEYLSNHGYPPISITPKGLNGGKVIIDGSISSQFLSALLMAAPLAKDQIEIEIKGELVSKPYVKLTLEMMQSFGVEVENNNYQSFKIKPQQYISPQYFMVEGDASSASYFLAAAAIAGEVELYGVGKNSIQGDIKFCEVLTKMGAKIELFIDHIKVSKGELNGVTLDLNHIPDAAMTLATLALFAKGTTRIENIYNWRVKETDRLSAMANELKKVGAIVTEGNDFIEIIPANRLKHAQIETYNDHRMAMCFSLLALDQVGVTILDPDCCAKTFPDFFTKFTGLLHN